MSLKISSDLSLPIDAATQTFAIIAQRRKGKTYTANVMAEEMVAAGIPWVALDPTGAWWGLRSSVNGKSAGLPVYVFGGDHGDLPLERTAGKMIADLVVEHPGWYVLDFSHFESKEAERQLATDFAERFYRRKGSNKTPVHLFVDEADMFAPQRTPSGDQRMLGAFEALVRRGGIRGIGTTLITQRAAVLNKNVLEQIDVLIALRTVGPNDRKAISGYVEANGTPEQKAALMNSIASLDLGEAWVWEPGADLFQKVRIRKRHTFNSSATPDASAPAPGVVKLAKVDLERISEQMAATIEKASAEDPRLLRQRIAELERRPKPEPKIIEKPILTREQVIELGAMIDRMTELLGPIMPLLRPQIAIDSDRSPLPPPSYKRTEPMRVTQRQAKTPVDTDTDAGISLRAGEQKILETLAARNPLGFTRTQLGTVSGYKASGGTFGNYFSALKRYGFITESGGMALITDKGLEFVGEPPDQPQGIEMWRKALRAGERAMLDVLVEMYPGAITREQLGEAAGFTASGGTFGNYLGALRRNGLVEVTGSEVRASENLFAGARR